MGKRTFLIALLVIGVLPALLLGWGRRGHVNVTDSAIDLLPEPLGRFYHLNRNYIAMHSIDPDLWVESKTGTPAYAHYIDLDLLDNALFDGIPKEYPAALAKFGEEKLKMAGTLPWEIARRKVELTSAFREKRWEDVVRESAWIAHFVADATMPLHTTKNYLGQSSGNLILQEKGPNRSVHHRLEWGLLDTFPEHYDSISGERRNVKRIDDVLEMSWSTVKDAYGLIPDVLSADRKASNEDRGFGLAYYRVFDESVRPLVERQLKRSQELIASVWLSAWDDAGRPELPARKIIIDWGEVGAGSAATWKACATPILVCGTMAFAIVILVWGLLKAGKRVRK